MGNERIYQSDDGHWFFRVRGNQDCGPFPTEAQAREMLHKHVATWVGRTSSGWPRTWRPTRMFRRSAARQS